MDDHYDYLHSGRNRCGEALDTLIRVIASDLRLEPAESDWYVLSRIAEQYGELELVRTYYRRVHSPKDSRSPEPSAYDLPQNRLKKLAS